MEDAPEDEKDAHEKILSERYFRYDVLKKDELKALFELEHAISLFKSAYKVTSKENN